MRTVEDGDGDTYLLLKQGDVSWLVRDPVTGEDGYRPATEFTVTEDSPLATAATGVPDPVRLVVEAAATDEALGLLVTLADRGPTTARTLLSVVDRCERDLQGLLGELQAAGAITSTEVGSEPGYTLTEAAATGVEMLRETEAPPSD